LSGIEAFITETNQKYANRITQQFKTYAKTKGFTKSYALYKVAYSHIPLQMIKLNSFLLTDIFVMPIKFSIITNKLGIIRHLAFYYKDFFGKDRYFSRSSIPLNSRSRLKNSHYTLNAMAYRNHH